MDQSTGTGQHAVESVQRAKRSEIPICSIRRLAPDPRGVLMIDSGRIIGTCAFDLSDQVCSLCRNFSGSTIRCAHMMSGVTWPSSGRESSAALGLSIEPFYQHSARI